METGNDRLYKIFIRTHRQHGNRSITAYYHKYHRHIAEV